MDLTNACECWLGVLKSPGSFLKGSGPATENLPLVLCWPFRLPEGYVQKTPKLTVWLWKCNSAKLLHFNSIHPKFFWGSTVVSEVWFPVIRFQLPDTGGVVTKDTEGLLKLKSFQMKRWVEFPVLVEVTPPFPAPCGTLSAFWTLSPISTVRVFQPQSTSSASANVGLKLVWQSLLAYLLTYYK